MSTDELQQAKNLVRAMNIAVDQASDVNFAAELAGWTSDDYFWRGMHPFYEQEGAAAVTDIFWLPLRRSFKSMKRREDVFMAGRNFIDDGESAWVLGMGHFMGLFDNDWLGIPATRKLTYLRYAEFHRVDNGKVTESALFCDVMSVMQQAGCYPLAAPTGAHIVQPGPATHDGIMLESQPPQDAEKTLALVNAMVADLDELNKSGKDLCPPELLQKSWHDDMIWYGPTGIGATYTIPRYQEQHQHPFRTQLKDKVFNGHVARIAEGNYLGFFGWANLTNTPTGGFLGLPGNDVRADMRVVDVYRRDGDKLAENWVFIDLLHWMAMQGKDVLRELREQRATA